MTIASHLDLIFNVIRMKLCKLVANLDHLPTFHCGFDYFLKKFKNIQALLLYFEEGKQIEYKLIRCDPVNLTSLKTT